MTGSHYQLDQHNAPLLERLHSVAQRQRAAFHTPGHKQGQGASTLLVKLLEDGILRADLPELPELDNLFAPEAVIQQAQALAAEAFGAEQTWFLANGSTCGIEAAVLATCNPGDRLILPRNVHQSAIAALILSGAVPIWVEPDYDSAWNLASCVSPMTIRTALDAHPDAKAVLVVSPTYHGICGDLASIAQIAHERHVPLLVDEAHGAHFAFHPDLPCSALAAGADLTVQSIHKTLSSLTQSAMLHVQGVRIDRDRLSKALQLVQSTSPSYLLLASLDAARQQMATEGYALMQHTLQLADHAKMQLKQIPELAVLTSDRARPTSGFFALDPTRLTADVTGLGISGFAADQILDQDFNVTAELPGLTCLTFILTLGNTLEDVDRLVVAFQTVAKSQASGVKQQISKRAPVLFAPALRPLSYVPSLSPREAFFSTTVTLPARESVNQISAELVCPYPPGIPVLLPGEVTTSDAICYLQEILANGGILSGCADPSLDTLKVVKVIDSK